MVSVNNGQVVARLERPDDLAYTQVSLLRVCAAAAENEQCKREDLAVTLHHLVHLMLNEHQVVKALE